MNCPEIPHVCSENEHTVRLETRCRQCESVITYQYWLIKRMGITLLVALMFLIGTMIRLAFAEGWVR